MDEYAFIAAYVTVKNIVVSQVEKEKEEERKKFNRERREREREREKERDERRRKDTGSPDRIRRSPGRYLQIFICSGMSF